MSQNTLSFYKRMTLSDEQIIKGIVEDNDMIIRYIYKKYFPGIRTMVRSFHNLVLNSDDIFQEGLTRAIMNVKAGKFQGKSTFYTYLNSICHYVCLQELKQSKTINPIVENIASDPESDDESQDKIILLIKIKENMDPVCQQIIDTRFGIGLESRLGDEKLGHHHNLKFDEIGKILGIDPANARQRFKRCMEKLRELLDNNVAWHETI